MSIAHTLLGLLEAGPRHGDDLKRLFDQRFGQDRPLHDGQVSSALARLLRDDLVRIDGVVAGDGPERERYAITGAGSAELARWLSTPEEPEPCLRSALHAKVVLALLSGRNAAGLLDAQRVEHLRLMRELTRRKADGDLADRLVRDHALFHLEADVRWLELAADRLDRLALEVRA